jgi:hypothetical protein
MMDVNGEMDNVDLRTRFEQLKAADIADAEKLARAFGHITGLIIGHAEKEIDLARAMHDQDTVIKQQIKMETLKHSRHVLDMCYLRLFGGRVWDE